MNATAAGSILSAIQGHIWTELCLTSKSLGIVPSEEEEQDMFAATCVAVMEAFTAKRASFDATKGTTIGYARRIAGNKVRDFARERWQTHRCPEVAQTEHRTPETACIEIERSERAITAYLTLSGTERKAVDATFNGQKHCSVKVRVAKHRAVKKLTAALAR